jgi:hypothetical protein
MSTVLWGKRKGDVQYNSRDYWRRNIPIGAATVTVADRGLFDVGDIVGLLSTGYAVVGIEGYVLGLQART